MKKFISLFIVFLFILSVAMASVSAEDSVSETQNVIHFDANTASHFDEPYEKIYCHIWEYGGKPFFNWQSRKEKCTDEDKDGIWTYSLDDNGIVLEDGKLYAVIFSNERGEQTYNLLFDETVLGDTAYCDGSNFDSPESIIYHCAYWRNQGTGISDFGPELYITSTGNVVGSYIPKTTTAQDIFEEFLTDTLENARIYSGKEDQAIVDDIATRMELTIFDVMNAIENTDVTAQWSWWKSPLEHGDFTPVIGDVDGDTTLSVMDATAIQRYKAGLSTIPEKLLIYGDVDKDTHVSVLDATAIQMKLAQLEE